MPVLSEIAGCNFSSGRIVPHKLGPSSLDMKIGLLAFLLETKLQLAQSLLFYSHITQASSSLTNRCWPGFSMNLDRAYSVIYSVVSYLLSDYYVLTLRWVLVCNAEQDIVYFS